MPREKRKHVTLSFEKKCQIIQHLEKGSSIRHVGKMFNVPRSTVLDIKKKKTEIKRYVASSFHGIGKCELHLKNVNNAYFIVQGKEKT